MQNVVSLQPDRPRPQRALGVPRDGARILFFTGVRYCRDEDLDRRRDGLGDAERSGRSADGICEQRALDAVAH